MFSALARFFAGLSLMLKQPLPAYCELETAHGDALVTKRGDYVSWLRVDGMQRMAERKDFAVIAEAMRLDLSGALEARGHAILGWFISDPDAALVEIERVNLASCRNVALSLGLDLSGILAERTSLWPKLMRWEAAHFIVWTRTSVLTKEERKQVRAEYAANARAMGLLGDAQRLYLCSEVMAARHAAFASRFASALRAHHVSISPLDPHEALRVTREAMYREMAGSEWRPSLPGDRVMARCPEEEVRKPKPDCLLWPPIRDQLFCSDAVTHGGQRVDFGENSYAPVDMDIGPEDPRPFVELAATLGQDRVPWRAAILLEGCGQSAMQLRRRCELSFNVSGQRGSASGARIREGRPPERQPHQRAPSRELRDLGARGRPRPAAPPGLDTGTARRGLGQRQGDDGNRRSARRRDEHGSRPRSRLDGKSSACSLWRCTDDAALESHSISLGVGQCAVPASRWRHLAL